MPNSHRAEQRLDDHVAAELGERLQGVGGPLAGDRAGCGQPGARQQGRGEELVDRPLDRVRAVHRAHAGGGKRVQHIHAEDDLLERAARDAAHEHDVAAVERQLARAHAKATLDAAHHPRHWREARTRGRAPSAPVPGGRRASRRSSPEPRRAAAACSPAPRGRENVGRDAHAADRQLRLLHIQPLPSAWRGQRQRAGGRAQRRACVGRARRPGCGQRGDLARPRPAGARS